MDAVEALTRLGGIADLKALLDLTTRKKLRRAVEKRRINRVAKNRYALPLHEAGRAAARLNGVMSHLSAAQHWGWEVKFPPAWPHVAVPRGRNVAKDRRIGVAMHWLALGADEVEGTATGKLRTVVDCARDRPFDEGLAVADSALRHRHVTKAELVQAATELRGPGADKVRRVAAYADGNAANPFESVLRALAIEAGLQVLPQFPIDLDDVVVHPDLADPVRGIVLEADSWTWHADKEAHDGDCWRYNALLLAGWLVLRFTYEHVMRRPDYVLTVLRGLVEGPPERPQGARHAVLPSVA